MLKYKIKVFSVDDYWFVLCTMQQMFHGQHKLTTSAAITGVHDPCAATQQV